MTQQVNSRLVEFNKCKDVGFPNTKIGFVKDGFKTKPDGKPFWKLLNEDMSEHVHKTTVIAELIDQSRTAGHL
jgi:hypothetical protein